MGPSDPITYILNVWALVKGNYQIELQLYKEHHTEVITGALTQTPAGIEVFKSYSKNIYVNIHDWK